MDGIHDLGGLDGFGQISAEVDEPVFHADWEKRVFALTSALPFALLYSDDHFRPAIEAMPPPDYLSASYYERWLWALENLIADRHGLSRPAPGQPAKAGDVLPAVFAGASQARPLHEAPLPRFRVGEHVRTQAHFGPGHNRLPRFARDKLGRVEAARGAFLVADAHFENRQEAEMLYTVVFDCRDLWGNIAAVGDMLSLDLWDRYLQSEMQPDRAVG